MTFADVEKSIAIYGQNVKDGTLALDDMSGGGTFTISNGGVFGSLMETPIINPPQCNHFMHPQRFSRSGERGYGDE